MIVLQIIIYYMSLYLDWNVFKSLKYFINCAFVSDLTLNVEKICYYKDE